MSFYSGFGGRVLVSGSGGKFIALPAGRWQVTDSCELIDITTTYDSPNGSQRHNQGIRRWNDGYRVIEATFDCYHNSALTDINGNPNLTTSLIPGSRLYLVLYIDKTDEKTKFVLRNFFVEEVIHEVGVRDIVKYTVKGKQSGNSSLSADGAIAGLGGDVTRPFQF